MASQVIFIPLQDLVDAYSSIYLEVIVIVNTANYVMPLASAYLTDQFLFCGGYSSPSTEIDLPSVKNNFINTDYKNLIILTKSIGTTSIKAKRLLSDYSIVGDN